MHSLLLPLPGLPALAGLLPLRLLVPLLLQGLCTGLCGGCVRLLAGLAGLLVRGGGGREAGQLGRPNALEHIGQDIGVPGALRVTGLIGEALALEGVLLEHGLIVGLAVKLRRVRA